MNHWCWLAVAIVAEVCGTTLLKYSESFTKWLPTAAALMAFALAFYGVSLVFRVLPVGITYAVWSGAGVVLTTLIGWLLLGQKLDVAVALGMGLIKIPFRFETPPFTAVKSFFIRAERNFVRIRAAHRAVLYVQPCELKHCVVGGGD